MRIIHVIFSFTTGGAETMLVDIVNEQVKQADVNIVIINKYYNQELIENIDKRVKVYFINRPVGSKNPLHIIRLNTLLLKLNADVLHCHNHNIAPLLLPSLKRKAILTLHSMGITTKYLRDYNQLFSISNSVKRDISNRTNVNSTVVCNGISTTSIKTKQDYNKSNMFKIICVGRLDHKIKGQHLAIEALHRLKEKGISNIQLDLIGTGSSEQYLKELTARYCLNEQVIFLGLKDRDYIYSHLKDYDLLVQPSLFEGFGLTVAEGMAAKIPVLVSDIDGPMEIIENGKYGSYFQSGNAADLANRIQQLIDKYPSPELQQKVASAYQHLQKNFDIRATAAGYIQNYSRRV